MNGPTHLIGGITSGLIASSVIGAHDAQTLAGVILAACAAMVPDRVQYTIKGVSLPLEGHRSASHTLLFAIGTSVFFNPSLVVFLFVGLLSHYILDLPSDAGIPLFWPLYSRRVALGWFRNGSAGEVVTRGLLVGACVFMITKWI